MSYIFKVSKWEGSPLGKEILTYFWCAWVCRGWSGIILLTVLRWTAKSLFPNAATHTKGKRKAHTEGHFWGFRAKFADLPSEWTRNAQRCLILYFDTSKPWINPDCEGEVAECAEGAGSHRELCWEEILSHLGTHRGGGSWLQICSITLAGIGRGYIKHA